MSENREEVLANFQGITGIEDVAEAILHLDETNWDLLSAVNRVLPQDLSSSNTSTTATSSNTTLLQNDQEVDVEMIDEDISIIRTKPKSSSAIIVEDLTGPSTSNSVTGKKIKFLINYHDTSFTLEIPDSCTVYDLRLRITDHCGIAPCRQRIDGLGSKKSSPPANATLASLNLPDECHIFLSAPEELIPDDESLADRLTWTYTLNIENEDKEYKLPFPGTKTVLQVKTDLFSLTDIPVRHQMWTGWPPIQNLDETVLALTGISYPEHNLKMRRQSTSKHSNKDLRNIVIDNSDSEISSVEEFEDAPESFNVEDDIFVDNVHSIRKVEPLLPDNIDDETTGCIQFAERFQERYGPQHPIFFQGSLENAIKEACIKPAKDRKLLGVYLHHEGSVLSNVFCAQLLGCDSVLQILANNFVVYGWDLSFESNKNLLLSSVSNSLGSVAFMTVRSIPVEKLPVLIIIMRSRSNTEIFSLINGNTSVAELLSLLVEAVERWSGLREEEMQEESERAARQLVKWEQDEAYRQSLEADRAKEEIKKAQELAMNQEKQRAESERQEAEAKKEAIKQMALSRLPPEPDSSCSEQITTIRVRLPQGTFLERRFTVHTPLLSLLDYLTVEGYPSEQYKVISSWPRKDLTAIDTSQTLSELKLYPQETVLLEER